MPELPEAETIVRGLRPAVSGRRIQDVEVVHRDVLRAPAARFRAGLIGRQIVGVSRRAKNVLLELDDGSVVWINLGMTGAVLPLARPRGSSPARQRYLAAATHPAVILRLERSIDLVFDDTRRFGTVEHLGQGASAARHATFGPEPLSDDFTPAELWRGLRASSAPVRSWLLDQRHIAGIGNIYANEALFLAGIHPVRRTRTIRRREAQALHHALREVLVASLTAGGTTIRDFRDADGRTGAYVRQLRVYDREGLPCVRCSMLVLRFVFGSRSAFYCPVCQPQRGAPRLKR